MKKDTWKTIIQVVISVLTAALTALGTTSCMGHGPILHWERHRVWVTDRYTSKEKKEDVPILTHPLFSCLK